MSTPKFVVFPIKHSPGRKLYLAHTRMRKGLSRLFVEAGYPLTTESWVLLSLLWEKDPLTQVVLGQKLEKDAPAISRLVDSLEVEGYVERRASPRDRRSREVALTAKGRAAREPLNQIATEFLNHAFVGVSSSDLKVFIGVLDHMIERLDAAPIPEAPARRQRANRRSTTSKK